DFELPDYKNLTIDRPIRELGDEDVDRYLGRFLEQYGELVDRAGAAEKGDHVTVACEFSLNGQTLHKINELTVELKPVLQFQDAELEGFDELLAGANAGDVREADLTVSQESERLEMRGETVHAKFTVQRIREEKLPELDKEFLERIGVESKDELRESVREILDRQLKYAQRQSARRQVLEKITESADWDLPEQLVLRQVENARRREILEMQQAGFTTAEIRARDNEIRQRAVSTTRQALKEHFVLDKIAADNRLEVTPYDIDLEIQMMAMQAGESARRVRARLQKNGMIENLDAQIRERKAVDFLLEHAEYQDVEMDPPAEDRIEAVARSVCGQQIGGEEPEEASGGR
ncbi:MAG: trigger factor, partial [Planctomycetaceae bacterium]